MSIANSHLKRQRVNLSTHCVITTVCIVVIIYVAPLHREVLLVFSFHQRFREVVYLVNQLVRTVDIIQFQVRLIVEPDP